MNTLVAFLRVLTDGYQLLIEPVFSVAKGMIEIPYVRTEGVDQPNKFYSARLKLTGSGVYEIKQLDEIYLTDFNA